MPGCITKNVRRSQQLRALRKQPRLSARICPPSDPHLLLPSLPAV